MDKAIYLLYSSYVSSERRRPKAKQTLLLLLFLLLLSLVPLSAHFHLNDPEKEGFFCHTRHERSPRDLSFPSSYLGPFSFRLNPFDAICTYISPLNRRFATLKPCLVVQEPFSRGPREKNLITAASDEDIYGAALFPTIENPFLLVNLLFLSCDLSLTHPG